jgi:hypothetical protein
MRYHDARTSISSGDVILFRGRGPVAWLIRTLTRSLYDHSAIAWEIGGRVLVIEARMLGGVKADPLSTRLADHAAWVPTGIYFDELRLKVAIRDLGRPYSFLNCFRALIGLPGVRGQFECAQLVASVLGLPDGGWTPQGLRDFFGDRPAIPLEVS